MSGGTSGKILRREAWPDVTGRPGLTQGRYGVVGNLELVAPATDDGLWVGWFNCDPVESYSQAGVQRWSGAMRFARGHRYVSADVTQVDAGPDYLEVVALTCGGTLRRHVWSPDLGFVDHGELAVAVAACSPVVQNPVDGSLHIATAGLDGRVQVLRGRIGPGYPTLTFDVVEPGIAGVAAVDAAWHDGHLDLVTVNRYDVAQVRCPAEGLIGTGVGPALAARLTVEPDGGRLLVARGPSGRVTARRLDDLSGVDVGFADDLVVAPVRGDEGAQCHLLTRRGGQLWHRRLDLPGAGAQLVEAQVWVQPGTTTVHRS